MIITLIILSTLNLGISIYLYLEIQKRPREVSNMKGRILTHKFKTRKRK